MKITDVRTMLLAGPDPHGVGGIERNWHVLFVRVDTDAGLYGLGEAGNVLGDRQAIAYARDWLVGRDPPAINPFIRAMLSGGLPPYDPQMSATATVDGGIVWGASGVEMAPCDLAGKILRTIASMACGLVDCAGEYRRRARRFGEVDAGCEFPKAAPLMRHGWPR